MLFRVLSFFFCILTLDKVFAQNDCEKNAAPFFRDPKFGELDPVGTEIVASNINFTCKL